MGIEEIQQALLQSHKVRINPAMAKYILENLQSRKTGELPIIAGDARTGVPINVTIPLEALRQYSQPTP